MRPLGIDADSTSTGSPDAAFDGSGSGPGDGAGTSAPGLPSISVGDLARRLSARESGSDAFVLVDVREPGEREVVVIPGAVAVPLGEVRARGAEALADAADGIPVLVHCKTGARSAEAVERLRADGVDAVDVTGGVLAWVRDVDPSQPTY